MTQLSLLDWQPPPEMMQPPVISAPKPSVNQHEIAHWQRKADYYLKLIGRFMAGSACSTAVRRTEISRLHAMRQATLEKCGEVI